MLMGLESVAYRQLPTQKANAPDSALETADRSIRAALAQAAVPYQMLYGTMPERLAQALQAINRLDDGGPSPSASLRLDGSEGSGPRPWVWMCDKCSDPQCEHRLLTALLAQRSVTPGP